MFFFILPSSLLRYIYVSSSLFTLLFFFLRISFLDRATTHISARTSECYISNLFFSHSLWSAKEQQQCEESSGDTATRERSEGGKKRKSDKNNTRRVWGRRVRDAANLDFLLVSPTFRPKKKNEWREKKKSLILKTRQQSSEAQDHSSLMLFAASNSLFGGLHVIFHRNRRAVPLSSLGVSRNICLFSIK